MVIKEKNILFVTASNFNEKALGGTKGSIRNYEVIKQFGVVNTHTVLKRSTFRSIKCLLFGDLPPFEKKDIDIIKKKCIENDINIIFSDDSTFGRLSKWSHDNSIFLIQFFHNCEYDYVDTRFGKEVSIKKLIYKMIAFYNEKKVCKYSNYKVALSSRDQKRIEQLYNCKVDSILPLALTDEFDKCVDEKKIGQYCLLFGPVGTANIEAFSWFVKEVSPYLEVDTLLAGKGFEEFNDWETEKVKVLGYVDDIGELYENARCVAIPLLSGCGMKIKTAEAMMFGKNIFGTEEAFSGYDLDFDKIGGKCKTADDFIFKINSFLKQNMSAFNAYSRKIYEEKHSISASLDIFGRCMEEIKDDLQNI